MGRKVPPPEQADSWGEFHARLEHEAAARDASPWTPLWWIVAAVLFTAALVCCAYAFQGGHWWLWLAMLAGLAGVGFMAVRAVERADADRERAVELARLEDAWLAHLERKSPTL